MKTITLSCCLLFCIITLYGQSYSINLANTLNETGLYYISNDSLHKITKLNLSLVFANQAGGGVHNGTGSGQKVYERNIPGRTSNIQVHDNPPCFYLYLDSLPVKTVTNWMFTTAKQPDDFSVLNLKERHDRRDFLTGIDIHIGGWGSAKSGISQKFLIPFESKKINEHVYQISFNSKLEFGEYCFIYAGTIPEKYVNNRVLDFSIPELK
jgi:hypothetical protein